MDGGQDSFLGSIQTAVRECAVNNKSCEYTLRLCSVAFRVVLGVLLSPDHITTDALNVSCSASNVLPDWKNTSS